jgi:hypothetical protein
MAEEANNADANVDEATNDAELALENDETSWDTEAEASTEVTEDSDAGSDQDLEDFDSEEEDDSDSESEEEAESEEADADDTEEAQDDTETDDSQTQQTEEERKAHNREMAEKRLEAKAARESSLRDSQLEFINEAATEEELAVRELQVEAYNNKVDRNTNKLTTDYERALKDFDVLRDPNPAIQAEVDAAIDAYQATAVRIDSFGNPIDVKGSLYDFLQTKADSIKRLTGLGAQEQIKSKAKERTKVTAVPSRAPKAAKADADIDAFDEEASRY